MNTRWSKAFLIGLFAFAFALMGQVNMMYAGPVAIKAPLVIFIDGDKVKFSTQPFVDKGTALVQFRPIFEKLHMDIVWNKTENSVIGSKEGIQVKLVVNQQTAIVNGKSVKLDAAPRMKDGSLFIPLRFLGESTGKKVVWDQANYAAYLTERSEDVLFYPSGKLMYIGQVIDSKMKGKGKLYHESGELWYDAEFVNNNVEGPGTIYYTGLRDGRDVTGDKVVGMLKNGAPNGEGKYYNADGALAFEGNFLNGRPEGYGKYYQNGQLVYDGQWSDNKYHGQGKLFDHGRLLYEGGFKENQYDGYGKLDMGDLRYEGEYKDGKWEGEGTFYYSDGSKKVATWKNGETLYGKKYRADGSLQYEAEFEDGYPAKGTFYYTNGYVYKGEWASQPFGIGTLYKNDTVIYSGEWYKGQPKNGDPIPDLPDQL